jgi:beta-lactamase regulating signal transducer with metallopeptidase domain
MTELFQWFWQHPLVELMGWTLVHFLWQGFVVMGPLAFSLWVLRRQTASIRYFTACTGLIVLSFCPVMTLTLLVAQSDHARWGTSHQFAEHNLSNSPSICPQASIEKPTAPAPLIQDSVSAQAASFKETFTELQNSVSPGGAWWSIQSRWMPIIASIWLTGVLLLSLRLLGGLWRVRCLRRRAEVVADLRIRQSLERLLQRMNIRRPVDVFQSREVPVPAVFGFWRPALILPASLLSGLTVYEVDSILAHELAHVRRHDWLVNVLQSILETLLFYHPAVWWVSSVIRAERENCCDDMAVQVCGDRLTLAKALLHMEEERCAAGLVLSAAGGTLSQRIRRLVMPHDYQSSPRWTAGLLTLAVALILLGGLGASVLASVSVSNVIEPPTEETVESPATILENRTWLTTPSFPDHWPRHQREVDRADERTGQIHSVLADVSLTAAEGRQAAVDLKYSNLLNYTFIPARIAEELGAIELGEIDFGDQPPAQPGISPQVSKLIPGLGIDLQTGALVDPLGDAVLGHPQFDESNVETITVNELTEPAGQRKIVPYAEDAFWVPGHLAFYGFNKTEQKRFRVVRIERVDLRLGPDFGPVNALVLNDENSSLGVLGNNWARRLQGPTGESLVWAATGDFYLIRFADTQENLPSPKLSVLQRVNDVTTLAELRSRETGRSQKELLAKSVKTTGNPPGELPGRVTDQKTLVSSSKVEYVLGGNEGYGMDAAELLLHLPEGSGVRAEFTGEGVFISGTGPETNVTISTGRVRMIDSNGVVRVDASADNGAELLIATVRELDGEFVVSLRAAFLNPDEHDFTPVVQAKLNLATGAPLNEEEPPHGAVRYGIEHDPQTRYAPMAMKMRWHYDLVRLIQEDANRENEGKPESSARVESSNSVPNLLPSQDNETRKSKFADETEWGQLAENSGLQSRLTLQTQSPKVGEPLLLKLELRNVGEKPTEFDPQDYTPFRVLRVDLPRPELPPPFIGFRPQTSGQTETLQPGEVRTLWEKVDIATLFLLAEAREYEIFAEGGEWARSTLWRDSNHLPVKLGPGTLGPREQLIANLVKIKPQDWTVNIGHGEIYMQHSSTNLKSDVTSIVVRFQKEKIGDDFQVAWPVPGQEKVFKNAKVDELGETSLGQTYILSLPEPTKAIWPTYIEDITRSLESLRRTANAPQQP